MTECLSNTHQTQKVQPPVHVISSSYQQDAVQMIRGRYVWCRSEKVRDSTSVSHSLANLFQCLYGKNRSETAALLVGADTASLVGCITPCLPLQLHAYIAELR